MLLVINLKNYKESYKNIERMLLAVSKVSEELGIDIYVSPPTPLLYFSKTIYDKILSQHVDPTSLGKNTGFFPMESVPLLGLEGSLINHAEHKIEREEIEKILGYFNSKKLFSVLCVDEEELKNYKDLNPSYFALEPPELIGGNVSVSKAKPDLILDALKIRKNLLVGAGIKTREDVEKAVELGVKGVLIASGFVKSRNYEAYLRGLLQNV